jgi:hypothetical protein
MPYLGKEPARVPVTAADIPDDSITAAKILDGVITAADIAAGAVDTAELAADAVEGSKIADNAVGSEHIAAGSVDNAHLATGIDAAKLTTGTIPIARIADDAVTNAKMADDAIDSAQIAAGAVDDAHIVDLAASKLTGALPALDGSNLTGIDLAAIRNDIATLALHSAVADNKAAYNLPNSFIDQFQDDTGIGTETTVDRNANEYIETSTPGSPDSYTKLLISSDHANGSSTFTDTGDTGHTITKVGSPTHSTAQAKFGASSINMTGNNKLTLPAHADWDVGSGNFAIDFWLYPTDQSTMWFFSGTQDQNMSLAHGHQSGSGSNGKLEGWASNSGSSWNILGDGNSGEGQANAGLTVNTWQHIAFTRSGDYWRIFKDGTQVMETQESGTVTDEMANGFRIGSHANSAYYIDGYIDEFRFSKGTARWTGTFTPPTAPYAPSVINATGTLISAAQTANAAQTKVSGVILYKNAYGTATLGTDLKIYFTCNGGTNWTESTPVAAGTFSTGILMAKCPEVTCTSGTDIRYKAVWANQSASSKETQLHGIAMNY